jgi:hypothetical protein
VDAVLAMPAPRPVIQRKLRAVRASRRPARRLQIPLLDMSDTAMRLNFHELPPAEQHTVDTFIDELSRRDTLVDAFVRTYDTERPSQVYTIPSADIDRRSADAVLRMAR